MNPTLLNGASQAIAVAAPYEQLLSENPRWALAEGSRHFDGKSAVFDALRKIAARLDQLGVAYAIVDGMALFRHGYRRFTEDVDVLVTPQDLKTIHEKLEGLGYLPAHRRSRHLRDTELGVRIEFLTAGDYGSDQKFCIEARRASEGFQRESSLARRASMSQEYWSEPYPGDRKMKPVAFPPPGDVSFESDGVRYVNLETLIELKLASGMTSPGRLRDLSDVLELIRVLDLPEEFSQSLNPYVREKFAELWRQSRKRYVTLWRDAAITPDVKTMDELIADVTDGKDTLEEMRRTGVTLDQAAAGYARLVTTEAETAARFDMLDESEFWDEAE